MTQNAELEGEKISDRLKYFREKAGLSQENLARSIGMYRTNYSPIELGKLPLTWNIASKISSAYPGVTAEWLLTGKGDAPGSMKIHTNEPIKSAIVAKQVVASVSPKEVGMIRTPAGRTVRIFEDETGLNIKIE